MGKQAQSIGVALKIHHIAPNSFVVNEGTVLLALAFFKKKRDGLLPAVAKRRISHIVGQTSGRRDSTQLPGQRKIQTQIPGQKVTDVVAQRTTHTDDLQAMGQSVMHEHTARQGENLGFVLQTPERRRKNQPVVIALKLTAVVLFTRSDRLSGTLPRQQAFPFHSKAFYSKKLGAIKIHYFNPFASKKGKRTWLL